MEWEQKLPSSFKKILRITINVVWVLLNVIIFLIAPIFIVSILLDFNIPLNMPIVMTVYVLGAGIILLATLMAIFKYGTKKRAYTALTYIGVVVTFLFLILTHLGGEFGQIRVDLTGITLRADINLFSNILIGTIIIWGIICGIELVSAYSQTMKERTHLNTILKGGVAICVILFLLTAAFFMLVMVSAMQIQGGMSEDPLITYNDGGTPFFYDDDDTLDFTYNISIYNGGSFRIQNILFRIYLYLNSTTSFLLTPGILLGTGFKTITALEAGHLYQDKITVGMDPTYLGPFILSNNTIRTLMFIDVNVAGLLPVSINTTSYWESLSIFYP
ncbi:MAG: hypothetical protein ACTSRS_19705 [Candidatus Helarchaeota archaeon]